MPATNSLRVETRLTNVSIGYRNEGYIADDVAPIILVDKQAGKILEGDLSTYVADPDGDDRISMGELPGLLKAELSEGTYNTAERAKGITVHDDEVDADNAEDAPYDVKVEKTIVATERLLLNRELRVARLFQSISAGETPYTPWDDPDSNPLDDVTAGHIAVRGAIGRPANSAIVPWAAFQRLRNNAALKSFFTGGATTSQLGLLSVDALKAIFAVDNIYIPTVGLVKEGNMPAGAVTGTVSDVWGNDVYLFYKAPRVGRGMITTAATYVWKNAFRGAARNAKGMVVTEDYDRRKRTLFIDARTYSEEKLLVNAGGYKLSSVMST
jgi:hypothetical protein